MPTNKRKGPEEAEPTKQEDGKRLKCACRSTAEQLVCEDHTYGDDDFELRPDLIESHWSFLWQHGFENGEADEILFDGLDANAQAKGPAYLNRLHRLAEEVPEIVNKPKGWLQEAVQHYLPFEKSVLEAEAFNLEQLRKDRVARGLEAPTNVVNPEDDCC